MARNTNHSATVSKLEERDVIHYYVDPAEENEGKHAKK